MHSFAILPSDCAMEIFSNIVSFVVRTQCDVYRTFGLAYRSSNKAAGSSLKQKQRYSKILSSNIADRSSRPFEKLHFQLPSEAPLSMLIWRDSLDNISRRSAMTPGGVLFSIIPATQRLVSARLKRAAEIVARPIIISRHRDYDTPRSRVIPLFQCIEFLLNCE